MTMSTNSPTMKLQTCLRTEDAVTQWNPPQPEHSEDLFGNGADACEEVFRQRNYETRDTCLDLRTETEDATPGSTPQPELSGSESSWRRPFVVATACLGLLGLLLLAEVILKHCLGYRIPTEQESPTLSAQVAATSRTARRHKHTGR
jgi:hypothetical protein